MNKQELRNYGRTLFRQGLQPSQGRYSPKSVHYTYVVQGWQAEKAAAQVGQHQEIHA